MRASGGAGLAPRTRQRYVAGAYDMDSTGTATDGGGSMVPSGVASQSGSGTSTPLQAGAQNVAITIETDDDHIGTGQVVDPQGYGAGRNQWDANGAHGPTPARTHYRLSRTEILKGIANRFVHSTAYIYFYGSMALASTLTVLISLVQDCPGTLFYSLELAINAVLIAEVGIRGYAFGKQFWKSTFNVVDLGLVILCAITLAVLFFSHDCSPYRRGQDPTPEPGEDLPGSSQGERGGKSEELLDSFLLILRNAAQLVRLLSVVRRSSSNVTTRVPTIDLDDARRYSLDWDLEEEGLAARQRMVDGGDRGARSDFHNKNARSAEEQRQLFDYEDEDEEL